MRILIAVVISAVTSVVLAPSADAVKSGDGELHNGTLQVGIETGSSGIAGSQAGPVDSRSSSLPALVRYVWTPVPGGAVGSLEGLCNAGGTPVVFGWFYRVQAFTHDGTVMSDMLECVAFPNGVLTPTPPPPPTLATSPTIGDVWRAVDLPAPIVGANPVTRGVTGLATEMWSGGPQTAVVAVTLGGFRVVGTARLVEYRFSTDEGAAGSSPVAGSASAPPATHRFARKGEHTLSVSSVWQATATMTTPGATAAVPVDLGAAVLTATVTYPVAEVRSRLVG